MCFLSDSTIYLIDAAFIADCTASGFSHIPTCRLTIPLPLALRAIWGCSPYETFLITFSGLRPMNALLFSSGNRHLITRGRDRLLLLYDLGYDPRTHRMKLDCSTIELVSNLPWCAIPRCFAPFEDKIQHTTAIFHTAKYYSIIFQVISDYQIVIRPWLLTLN